MSAPPKVIRAMRARHDSRLACGCYVTTGQPIIRRGGQWICLPCRLAELRELAGIMRTPAEPSERGGAQ